MSLRQCIHRLKNKQNPTSWDKCVKQNLEKRFVQVQRQMVRMELVPSSSASTDVSGEENSNEGWESSSWSSSFSRASVILQDAEIDIIVANEPIMDDTIIAGGDDALGIDSDELSL